MDYKRRRMRHVVNALLLRASILYELVSSGQSWEAVQTSCYLAGTIGVGCASHPLLPSGVQLLKLAKLHTHIGQGFLKLV